ncbi:hypothetical protein [Agromyces italicus]|uniref:hypothetical protein n=1 Tax=Agromyces italicus TaxID=279572 RepID=UPI0003B76A57|nr:hypothetical protein [Agromyces italicus]
MLATAAAVTALSGCVLLPAAIDADAHAFARGEVADVARGLYGEGDATTIEHYARAADEALGRYSWPVLIGYEAYPGASDEAPVGRLQFRVVVPSPGYGAEDHVACFWSEFDRYGVAPGPTAGDTAVAHDLDCPPGAQKIDPPVDTSPVYVVPEGTEQVVVDVLTAAPPDATANAIVAEVIARMPQPSGRYDVAYEPTAIAHRDAIGFAMGQGDECLLVKRTASVVEVVHAPSILLEPGELGCQPSTALRPPEDLRAPH